MFRTTPMPVAGLRRAHQLVSDDVVLEEDGGMWRVHSIVEVDGGVQLTLWNVWGEKRVVGYPADRWVQLVRRPETDQERRRRVVARGMPWFVAGCVIALVAWFAEAPAAGGQWVAIIGFWALGCIRMATTPEQDR